MRCSRFISVLVRSFVQENPVILQMLCVLAHTLCARKQRDSPCVHSLCASIISRERMCVSSDKLLKHPLVQPCLITTGPPRCNQARHGVEVHVGFNVWYVYVSCKSYLGDRSNRMRHMVCMCRWHMLCTSQLSILTARPVHERIGQVRWGPDNNGEDDGMMGSGAQEGKACLPLE